MTTICLSPNGEASYRSSSLDTVLVGTIRGVVRLERDGGTWAVAGSSLEGHHLAALLRDEESGRVVAATYKPSGIFVSEDDGRTWSDDRLGRPDVRLFSLTARQTPDGPVILAGSEPVRLFASSDLGASWSEWPGIAECETEHWVFPTPPRYAHLKHVASHPVDQERLYASIEQGALLQSDDGGASWHEVESFLTPEDRFHADIHRLAISPAAPERLFMTTGEGFYRSLDGGRSWEHPLGAGARVAYPDPMFLDPLDAETLYVAGAGHFPGGWTEGPEGASDASVLRSTDAGATWQEVSAGLPQPVLGNLEAMSMHTTGESTSFVFATTQGEVYLSEDGADHWQRIATGLPPVSKSMHFRKFLPAEERAKVEAALREEMAARDGAAV